MPPGWGLLCGPFHTSRHGSGSPGRAPRARGRFSDTRHYSPGASLHLVPGGSEKLSQGRSLSGVTRTRCNREPGVTRLEKFAKCHQKKAPGTRFQKSRGSGDETEDGPAITWECDERRRWAWAQPRGWEGTLFLFSEGLGNRLQSWNRCLNFSRSRARRQTAWTVKTGLLQPEKYTHCSIARTGPAVGKIGARPSSPAGVPVQREGGRGRGPVISKENRLVVPAADPRPE